MKPSITLSTFLLLGIAAGCNKNSNQLAPISAPETRETISKFAHNTLLLDATVYKHTTANSDSFSVSFRNRTSATLSRLHLAVEMCNSLPQQYDGCRIYLDTVITLAPGGESAKYLLGKNLKLPLSMKYFNIYILSYDAPDTSTFRGVYANRFSMFLKDSTPIAYPQLHGFVTADGEALFRIKLRDSLYYTISEGRFQGRNHFSGKLFAGGQIKAYISLDTAGIVLRSDTTAFRLRLSASVEDSTNNIYLNAFRKP